VRRNAPNKYYAKKTYSQLCDRTFDSKAEARRGEELSLLERAGEISKIEYQVPFTLCQKPKIAIKIDFAYCVNGAMVYEDAKGLMTREFRVKMAWLKEKYGIDVLLTKP